MTPVCPECAGRPADPLTEIVERCDEHARQLRDAESPDDARVREDGAVPVGEAGGEANRRWCDVLHRGER